MKRMLLVLVTVVVAACGGRSTVSEDIDKNAGVAPDTTTTGIGDGGVGAGGSFGTGSGGPVGAGSNVVYFELDQSDVKREYIAVVTEHAEYLLANPGARVRLEGHADERGSREYNIGLGERRSQSVRLLLRVRGVSDAQMSTVSYGEERPATLGSSENAWAQNRRVELVYVVE